MAGLPAAGNEWAVGILYVVSIIHKDKNVTASALLGVAAIQNLLSGIDWYLHGGEFERFEWFDWLITLSGVVYIALGIAARWIRLPAAILGSVFYAAFFAWISGLMIIIMIPIVVLLLVALVSALKRPAAEK